MTTQQHNPPVDPTTIHPWEKLIVMALGLGVVSAIIALLWGHLGELKIIKIGAGILGLLAFILCSGVWKIGIRGLFKRRSIRFLGWYFAGVISLIVFLYVFEGWRGKRAWNALVKEVEAGGETLHISSIFPKAMPDDQNLIFTPEAAKYFFGSEPRSKAAFYEFHEEYHSHRNWVYGAFTDFKRWHESLRRIGNPLFKAVDSTLPANTNLSNPATAVFTNSQYAKTVIDELEFFNALFKSLKTATNRVTARFPLNPHEGWFAQTNTYPRFALRALAQALSLHASAQLALGKSDEAYADIMLSFRLADALSGDPFFYSWKIKAQLNFYILQPIWEGISRHIWTEPQLSSFGKNLESPDVNTELKSVWRNDIVLYIDLADRIQSMDNSVDDLNWVMFFYPKGWLYLDRVWLYRFYQRHTKFSPVDYIQGRHAFRIHDELREIDDPFMVIYVLPRMLATFDDILFTATQNQIFFRLAATACALEQYRLKNGLLPKSLEELTPTFLANIPADINAKQRLVFQSNPDGSYRLYSVGWNQRDEGGEPPAIRITRHVHGLESLNADRHEGDWPWMGMAPATP